MGSSLELKGQRALLKTGENCRCFQIEGRTKRGKRLGLPGREVLSP